MKKKLKTCLFRIISLYIAIPSFIALVLYFFLPIMLHYPPESIDNQFQLDFDGITYTRSIYSFNCNNCIMQFNYFIF